MTRVKICGITDYEDAMAACEAGVDALGFVFAPEAMMRNRYIAPDSAQRIAKQLPPFVSAVAVCVNETPRRLAEYLEFMDYVQLCGEESVEDCIPVAHRAIKVFHITEYFEPEIMTAYPTAAYLLDAGAGKVHGGTGTTIDWTVARNAAALGRRIILAGGLTPENVAEAVRIVQPYGVDASGGVEREPGKKDHERMRQFVLNAKKGLGIGD